MRDPVQFPSSSVRRAASLRDFECRECGPERREMSGFVAPNLPEAVGGGVLAHRRSLLGELSIHCVDLVGLTGNRLAQVIRIRSEEASKLGFLGEVLQALDVSGPLEKSCQDGVPRFVRLIGEQHILRTGEGLALHRAEKIISGLFVHLLILPSFYDSR